MSSRAAVVSSGASFVAETCHNNGKRHIPYYGKLLHFVTL